jgi:murein DD-endopeptidase MepM/ murein hydrolase activator NlpD
MGRQRWLWLWLLVAACHARSNPYESASPAAVATWKRVGVPLAHGSSYLVSQGAFGKASHSQKGIEYRWDFDVPYGTSVVAADDGTVIAINVPNKGGGCDPKYSEVPNTMLVKHADGTVAQYTHIDSRVAQGASVKRGDVIAITSKNGNICSPQLDFLIFKSEATLYDSPARESIPLRFDGIVGDRATEGLRGVAP